MDEAYKRETNLCNFAFKLNSLRRKFSSDRQLVSSGCTYWKAYWKWILKMSSKSNIPKTVNPDLQKERDGASFSSEEFAIWWAGGAEKLKFSRSVSKLRFYLCYIKGIAQSRSKSMLNSIPAQTNCKGFKYNRIWYDDNLALDTKEDAENTQIVFKYLTT